MPPGTTKFRIGSGQFRELGKTPRQLYIESVRFGSQNGFGPVTIAEGANPPLELVLTDKVGTISASVSTENGQPAESAALVASRLGEDFVMSLPATSFSRGYGPFRLEGLVPGDYLVAAFIASDDQKGVRPGQPDRCGDRAHKLKVIDGQTAVVNLRPCIPDQNSG